MTVITPAEATVHEFHGTRWTSFVSPSKGSKELCAWRADIPAGSRGAAHRVNHEEVLLVLAGTLVFIQDGRERVVEAGDVMVVEVATEISVDNRTPEPAAIWTTTSVGFAGTMADGTEFVPEWAK